MKRIVGLMLMIAMLLSVSAFAENRDIDFRGLPWGCSPAEAIELLKKDLQIDEKEIKFSYVFYNLRQYEEVSKVSNYPLVEMLKCSITVPDLKVAGYKTQNKDNIELYFLPILSEDGQSYSLSEQEGMLWRAVYPVISKPGDVMKWTMREDLEGKLEALYGKKEARSFTRYEYSNGEWGNRYRTFEYYSSETGTLELYSPSEYSYHTLDYRWMLTGDVMSDARQTVIIREMEAEAEEQRKLNQSVGNSTDGL